MHLRLPIRHDSTTSSLMLRTCRTERRHKVSVSTLKTGIICVLQTMDKDNSAAMTSIDKRLKRHVGSTLAKCRKLQGHSRGQKKKMFQTELNPQTGQHCEYAVVSCRAENYLYKVGPWQHYN